MKLTATLGLILVCWHACTTETHGYALKVDPLQDDKWQHFLENTLRTKLQNGDDELGIPKMEPLLLEDIPLDVENDEMNLHGKLTNIEIHGLSQYHIERANGELIRLKFSTDANWEQALTANLKYIVDYFDNNQNLHGEGDISLTAGNLRFTLDITLQVNNNYVAVKNVETNLDLGTLDIKITGLIIKGSDGAEDEDVSENASALASIFGLRWIKNNHETIAKQISATMTTNMSKVFFEKEITLEKLLEIIGYI